MAESMSNNAASMASSAVSIGNYKGVMLCNRPFNGVSSTLAKESKGSSGNSGYYAASGGAAGATAAYNNNSNSTTSNRSAFLAGIPAEPLGMNVPIYSEPVHAIKRDKKNTALSKHKKWLYELQKERTRLQEALLEDEEKKRKRKEKFAQREAKFRDLVRSNQPEGHDEREDPSAKADPKKLHRPAWALTKETADEKEEFLQDAEADDLIEFANNLDIDQFMDDVEIKARVAQVEQQLAQIQSIVDNEEAEEKRQERLQGDDKAGVVPLTAHDLAKLDRLSGAKTRGDEDDDAMSVASTVLSECKSIRSVHSVRSVAALTKRMEAKLLSTDAGDGSITPPRIVTIDEEQGVRMQIKQLPSNLPYIHRNPAI